ncbi:lytic transglycosylase domain-containing protein [Streptomyces tagetis]|uniref:Lytic transglycosylase domain-containing protein n=1 Tax=Streptomyces tagetis TaxID=2820809 RepID=A0A940XHY5_9ACTN|nr:lytic transglycosylase domain-containing protein [Streptomyces sp. RG38]MBQ0827507.1 lytic transglycosylase domain-containing protein [Streptomyces sp. RG38]
MSAESEGSGANTVRNVAAAGVGCGCLMSPVVLVGGAAIVIVIGGFGVLLAPLIALILLFGGGGGSDAANEDLGYEIEEVFHGDGKQDLDENTVPDDLVDSVKKAGDLCAEIGPIVIASQLESASGFNAGMKGPHGEQGVAQLPPDVFAEYGEDDDDNDKVDALDTADSIMALGRYMCALAEQAKSAIDAEKVEGSVLDITLAAYKVGMDTVVEAKGVPQTDDAQGYLATVRAQFAKYAGIAAPPDGATPGVTPSPDETAGPEPADTATAAGEGQP